MGGDRISGLAPWRRQRRTITVPVPAAGADWSYTVPGDRITKVEVARARLVTSAVVVTRVPWLVFTDGNVNIARVISAVAPAASHDYVFSWWPAAVSATNPNDANTAMPELTLLPGWTIGSVTGSIDAGDQWSAIYLTVLETIVQQGEIDIAELPEMLIELVGRPS